MRARRTLSAIVVITAVAASVLAAPARGATSALAWQPCPGDQQAGFECTTLDVPADRTKPAGRQFTLALIRHRATGTPDQRIGSMLVNPGGPGGSGVENLPGMWAPLPDEVKQRFDVVSWDPRGVGASTPSLDPQVCSARPPTRKLTGAVDWSRTVADYQAYLATVNAACQRKYADVIGLLGTNNVVADMDRIRAAVGDDTVTYWGASYGTRIGYVYALRYPDRVRAIVLDGPVDPASTYASFSESAAAPDQAFGSWADAYPQSAAKLTRLLALLDRRTWPVDGGVVLDRWVLKDFIVSMVAHQSGYATITEVVDGLYDAVWGTGDAKARGMKIGGQIVAYQRTQPALDAGGMFSVVNCLDYADRPTLAFADQRIREIRRIAPRFGPTQAVMQTSGCQGFTMTPDPVPVITGNGSPVPLLILGASRDGATIVQWTARMSRAFPNSRTETYAGGQHVTWGLAGSDCVNNVADAWVISLTLPAMDRACPNAYLPPTP